MKIPLAEMMHRAQPKRRRAILPPINTTRAQGQRFNALYVRVIRIWVEVANSRILPAYRDTLPQVRTTRDSIPDIEAAIAAADERIVTAIAVFEDAFREWANDLNLFHLRQLTSQIKYATSIDLSTLLTVGDVQMTIEDALRQNLSLVRSVSDEIRNRISGSVFRGLQRRTPIREVAKEMNQATQLGRARSLRIASDQTVKLAASLDRERHAQLGITHFKWRHSGKAHPRQIHLARNGKVFKWESKVGREDPPGWLPFCGCKAQGIIGEEPEAVAEIPPAVPAPGFQYQAFRDFRSIAEAEQWMAANIATTLRLPKTAKTDGLSDLARATLEVMERFGLGKMRFIGDPALDTALKWRWSSKAIAAYGPTGDALLFKTRATSRARVTEGNEYGQSDAYGLKQVELAKTVVAQSRFISAEVKEKIGRMERLYWSESPDALAVGYHEMGHRLEQFNRREIAAIFYQSDPIREGWHYLVSRYSATNRSEYVAETFALYMRGDESQYWRIMPKLLEFYKSKDKARR